MSQQEYGESHISPATILQHVAEAEDKLWSHAMISESSKDGLYAQAPPDFGSTLIRHAGTVQSVHGYFTNLEQRKCCLLLAACKTTFTNVRLVRNDGRDSGIEEGAMMKTVDNVTTVPYLDALEFDVFQHAYMCAAFPVLGAPEPPSEMSPTPVTPGDSKRPSFMRVVSLDKSKTSFSHHDSGIDEHEDTATIPAETLYELLRRTYRLSNEKFYQYEEIIAGQYERKSPQKILAEELVRQLIALENNNNPFYNPRTFLNRQGYDQWQLLERGHITELLQKFWHFSLPQPTSAQFSTMKNRHQEYKLLMEKLIRYESSYRQLSEFEAQPPTAQLSSASVRLLKEFGLRYGVGEQYRRIVYLHYLALNFDPTVWFIQHVTSALTAIMDALPVKKLVLVMTKEELSKLEASLNYLEDKTVAAIAKMKILFPNNRPAEGLESLLELLSATMQAKSYFGIQTDEQLGAKLHKILQSVFPMAYERHKMVAKDELRQNKWAVELNPKLLNMLIGKIRDEVLDYKQNYHVVFQGFFDVTTEAAQTFYKLLMDDISQLYLQSQDDMSSMEIDLLMLSLAYRLHQLDQDWAPYIMPQMQTWRDVFLQEGLHWVVVMKVEMQTRLTEAVARDKFQNVDLEWTGSLHRQHSQDSQRRDRTLSSKSLTPSINSAFSSLASGSSGAGLRQISCPVDIHPPPPIREGSAECIATSIPKDRNHLPSLNGDTGTSDLHSERRSSSDPVNISRTSRTSLSYVGEVARSLGHYDDTFLSFAHMRHSSSLPNMHSPSSIPVLHTVKPKSHSVSVQESQRRQKSYFQKARMDAADNILSESETISPEISGLLEKKGVNSTEEDSDSDASTICGSQSHDSESDENDFSFPPLEEVSTGEQKLPSANFVSKSTKADDSDLIVKPTVIKSEGKLSTAKLDIQTTSMSDSLKIPSTNVPVVNQEPGKDANVPQTRLPLQSSAPSQESGSLSHDRSDLSGQHYLGSFTTTSTQSNELSFPRPRKGSTVTVPLSSSAVDVIVILQRLVGFGKTLCRTLAPVTWTADWEHQPRGYHMGGEEDMGGPPVFSSNRQKMYDGFLSCICNVICLYADNILCMDLCGTTQAMAKKLVGPRLVEYLKTQQNSGLIWGCRHNYKRQKNCFEYINKRTDLLCDRHEPITRDMCTRINNVMSMLTYIDIYHHRLGQVFTIFSDWSVRQRLEEFQRSINSSQEYLRSEFIVVENYDYNPAIDRRDVLETVSQRCPSSTVDASHSSQSHGLVVSSPVEPFKQHLMAVLRAQSRLMAYRLNLFVADALPVLLGLKTPNVPIEVALKPVTEFLSSYIEALNEWLYQDSFRRVLECMWIFLVQDFESELSNLERLDASTETMAQLLIQAISHLLKFMNSQEQSLRKELLLAQAEDVSFKLQLHAMPTKQLISLHYALEHYHLQSELYSTDSQEQMVNTVRQRIKADLQTLNKCFSGNDLILWILDNRKLFVDFDPDLAESSAPFTRDTAYHVAQKLLEWELVSDVESDTWKSGRSRADSLISSLDKEFPDLTILSQQTHHGGQNQFEESDDFTPTTTPRSTPHPTVHRPLSRPASRPLSRTVHSLRTSHTGRRSKTFSPVVPLHKSEGMHTGDTHTSNLQFESGHMIKKSETKHIGRGSKLAEENSAIMIEESGTQSCVGNEIVQASSGLVGKILTPANGGECNKDSLLDTSRCVTVHVEPIRSCLPEEVTEGQSLSVSQEHPSDEKTAVGIQGNLSLADNEVLKINGAKFEEERDPEIGAGLESQRNLDSGMGEPDSLMPENPIKLNKNDTSECCDHVVNGAVIHVAEVKDNIGLADNGDNQIQRPVGESVANMNFQMRDDSAMAVSDDNHSHQPIVSLLTNGLSTAERIPSVMGQESMSSGYRTHDFDPYSRSTPMSIRSSMSSSSQLPAFMDSLDRFYFLSPFLCIPDDPRGQRSYKTFELQNLMEQCFQWKVSPGYLFRVIYSRRQSDLEAKNFLRTYSEVSNQVKDEAMTCVSS